MAKKLAANKKATKESVKMAATEGRVGKQPKAATKPKPKAKIKPAAKVAAIDLTMPDSPKWVNDVDKHCRMRHAELHRQKIYAEVVLARYKDFLFGFEGVSGVHVGLRRRQAVNSSGKPYDRIEPTQLEYAIRVSVQKKRPKSELSQVIPSSLDGVLVDVYERSFQQVQLGSATGSSADAKDPLVGGIQIGNTSNDRWGTLGICGKIGGRDAIITNHHVIEQIQDVTQPGGSSSPIIGVVSHEYSPIHDEYIDAAIVMLNGSRKSLPDLWSYVNGTTLGDQGVAIDDVGMVDGTAPAFLIGAATGMLGLRPGRVQSTNSEVDVTDPVTGVVRRMKNQIVVAPTDSSQPIIESGDSGSVLFQVRVLGGMQVANIVGLVHAKATDGSALASHWWRVRDKFDFRVI